MNVTLSRAVVAPKPKHTEARKPSANTKAPVARTTALKPQSTFYRGK